MADLTRTRAQLRIAIASKLGILMEGNTVSGNDSTIIDDGIDNIFRELDDQGLIRFDIEGDAIGVNVYSSLAFLIADSLAEDFGLPTETAARLNAKSDIAMSKIREAAFEGAQNTVTRIEYF